MSENAYDQLIRDNDHFILSTARAVTHRAITRSDDEYSIALTAFWEAARTHNPEKGSLKAYSAVVIKHRLIDYIRACGRRSNEISAEPEAFNGSSDEDSLPIQREIQKAIIDKTDENVLSYEISELSEMLKPYGISFFDLPECCPKARKTRSICLKAAKFVSAAERLLNKLRRTLRLPAAEMETGVPVSRKIIDKFRKYIIAGVEIEAGDFPGIREFLDGKEADA